MRKIVVPILLVLAVACHSEERNQECEPGSTFIAPDGCSQCTCSDSGTRSDAVCDQSNCEYRPCDGLSCGESCSVCPPDDADCVAPAVETYCNRSAECVANEPAELCEGVQCGAEQCQLNQFCLEELPGQEPPDGSPTDFHTCTNAPEECGENPTCSCLTAIEACSLQCEDTENGPICTLAYP